MSLPPAGWFPNPDPGGVGLRYWDGAQWTSHYHQAEPALPPARAGQSVIATLKRTRSVSKTRSETPTIEQVLAQTKLEVPRQPLVEQVEVSGETYYVKGIRKIFEANAMPISDRGCTLEALQCILVPTPWNEHDPNAIAVAVGEHQVGHLPAELAVEYAVGLGRLAASGWLATGEARIWAKNSGGMVRARVTLLIPEAHRF